VVTPIAVKVLNSIFIVASVNLRMRWHDVRVVERIRKNEHNKIAAKATCQK